jgi:ATP phosphoribosyltransferase
VNLAKDYLKKNKVKATVEFSWGATEVKPPRFADAVIDLVETGVSLEAHNLKILDTVFESSTMLIANVKTMEDSWKKEKIKSLNLLLEGAVEGERMTGLTLDVPRAILKKVLKVLPAMLKPTVTKMPNTDFYNVFTSASKVEIRKLVPKLKKLGCEGIVEYSLRKVIP